MDKKEKDELVDKLFNSAVEGKEVNVTNSDIFTLDEWLSFSKERQESIAIFVTLTQNMKEIDHTKIKFDDETSKFIAMEGIKRILKEI
jgi:hypothetical protein